MEQSLRSQVVLSHSRNSQHYTIQNSPPPVRILSQIDAVNVYHSTSVRSFLILASHLRLSLPSGLVPSGFCTKCLYTPLLFPIRATKVARLSFLDLITRMIFGEEHKAPCYVVFSTPLLPRPSKAQVSFSATYSRKPSAYIPPSMCATRFHTHI